VGNVNLPTPIVFAGAGLCLLGGYLVGVVAGPDAPDRTTGIVDSYDAGTRVLCLSGEGVEELDGVEEGTLCGVWQRAATSATVPREGDRFRFVSKLSRGQSGEDDDRVLLFGEVEN
jgi:hypothetical protein